MSVGLAEGDALGASAEVGLPLLPAPSSSQGGGLFQSVEAVLGFTVLGAFGDKPCPPSGTEARCPRGSDFIVRGGASTDIFRTGPLALRGQVSGGVALGSASEPEGQGNVGSEARTAGAVVYGAALAYRITPRVHVFGQYDRFAIFTGDQAYTGPNGPYTVDLGTETNSLLSVGVGIGL